MKQFNKMKQIIITISIVVAVLIALFVITNRNQEPVVTQTLGGFESSYSATTTDSTYANSRRMIKTSSGVLHTVVVGLTSATAVELRDATSTTDIASTTLVKFGASPATGTYLLDVAFSRGLSVVTTGSFTGNYTITSK